MACQGYVIILVNQMSDETIKFYFPTILVSILSLLLSVVALAGFFGVVLGDLDLGGVATVATFPFLITVDFILDPFIYYNLDYYLEYYGLLKCSFPLCYPPLWATIIIIWFYPLFTFLLNWLVVRFLFKRSNK